MRPRTDAIEQVRSVREQLAQVSRLLITPHRAVAECCECLERAAELMRALEASGPGARQPGLAPELANLRRDLVRVDALVRQATAFYAGCASLLRSSSGYDGNGDAHRLAPASRVVAEG